MHLATQIPAHWLTTPSTSASAHLAIRKVVWRALLQRFIILLPAITSSEPIAHASEPNGDGTGQNTLNARLGRLPDAAYTHWSSFIPAAAARLHRSITTAPGVLDESEHHSQGTKRPIFPCAMAEPSRAEQGPLEVLHVLRCLLGPLVESLIVLDRLTWLREMLEDDKSDSLFDADIVNLFDQATGSGRNIAIVVAPRP